MSSRAAKRKEAAAEVDEANKRAKKDESEDAPPAADDEAKSPPTTRKRAAASSKGSPTDMENFDHYLFEILAFKAEHGNYHVTKEDYPELHAWIQFLKREYKQHLAVADSSQLDREQIKVLEFLHVPLTSRGDDHWNRFYELLKQYNERHGHVLVPRLCEIPGLGDWVTDQRRQYKAWKQGQSTQLTKERREKLEELKFMWVVRNRPEWDHRYNELLAYKEKHGDCKVPQHFKENKALGKWVAKQREQYKLMKKGQHSFLTPYRLEKLNQAGFVWAVRTALETDELMPVAATTTTSPPAAAPAAVATTEQPPPETTTEQPHPAAEQPPPAAPAAAPKLDPTQATADV